jgi:hypothetical protein
MPDRSRAQLRQDEQGLAQRLGRRAPRRDEQINVHRGSRISVREQRVAADQEVVRALVVQRAEEDF